MNKITSSREKTGTRLFHCWGSPYPSTGKHASVPLTLFLVLIFCFVLSFPLWTARQAVAGNVAGADAPDDSPREEFRRPQRREIVVLHLEDMQSGRLEELIALGCPVFHRTERFALSLLDEGWGAYLESLDIAMNVVDEYAPVAPPERYYLITERSGRQAGRTLMDGEILCTDLNGWLLYRGSLEEALWLQGNGHGLICLDPEDVIDRPCGETIPEPAPLTDDLTPEQIALIEEMVDAVSRSTIETGVDRLSSMQNRICFRPGGVLAGEGIFRYFESLGFDSLYTQTVLGGLSSPNVVAVLPGTVHPERVYLVGGHYDSITYLMFGKSAPGADDNASGTMTVLEAARVLSDYDFESTLIFITFSGEEIGLFGSSAFAKTAKETGMDLRGVVNIDMDGYLQNGGLMDLDIITNNDSYNLYLTAAGAAEYFVPELPTVESSGISGGSSDHASFWSRGFKAIWFFEDSSQYSPWIHTIFDLVGTSFNSPELAWRSTQVTVATLAVLAVPVVTDYE